MKKLFSLLTLALLTMSAWAQSPVTLDFTTNDWGLPTAYTVEEDSFTAGGYTITIAGTEGAGYKFSETNQGNYLIFGKSGAYLTLPAFSNDVKKIEVVGRSGASTSVKQNLYVGDEAICTETTGAVGTNTYTIPAEHQAAGTIYTLKVTSNHNSQITSIVVYFEDEPEPVMPEPATLAAANALEDNTAFKFKGDAVVTYHNGKYMFLRDDSGYGLIYYDAAPATNFANGAVLSQNWTATKTTYKSLVEYQHPANVSASGVSNSALAALQTIEVSQMANMINAYVKIEHVKSISGTTATLTDGTTITLYNRFTGVTIPEFTDQDCSITGIVSIFNDALQLYFIESDYNSSVEPPVEGTTFALVTDAASLADGDKIIIVNNEALKAMGALNSSGNNFSAVNVTINDNIIVTNAANVITLEAQDNNWALKANEGYLYAASSSANHLKPKAEVDGDAIASIAIENNEANITFQGQYTRNILRYNKSNNLFSCYASGQEPVYIYKATTDVPPVAVEAPVFDPAGGSFTGTQTVTLTCATEGAQIYYALGDGEYQLYETPFTLNATTTVKAKAVKGDAESAEVTATYTKRAEVSNIAAANELPNKTDFVFYGPAVVVYQNGSNLWIKDNTGFGLIYGNQLPAIAEGSTLAEGWEAQHYLFRGKIHEYQYPTGVAADPEEELQTITATEYTRDQLNESKINERVMIKDLTLVEETDSINQYWKRYMYNIVDGDTLTVYKFENIEYPAIEEGKTYDVEAMVSYYGGKVQLLPIAITEHTAAGLRGDVDNSGNVDISDATALINYLLYGNSDGLNMDNANCDLTGGIDISDATTLINYLLYGTW